MRPLLTALAVLLGLGSTGRAQDDPQATRGVIPAGQSAPAPAPAASDSVGPRNNPTVDNAAPDQAQPSNPIPIPGRLGYAYAMVGQHRVIIEMSTMRVMRFLD
jgi:hypothetical protein